jgi:hypothetical protein
MLEEYHSIELRKKGFFAKSQRSIDGFKIVGTKPTMRTQPYRQSFGNASILGF